MKKLILLVILIAGINSALAQVAVGRWQANSATIAKVPEENYQFFADGTFNFNVGGDETLTRVKSISGTYQLTDHTLILTPAYYMEATGGTLSFEGTEPGNSGWDFEDVKYVKVMVEKPQKQEVNFRIYKKQGVLVFEIDQSQYFKISSDPAK